MIKYLFSLLKILLISFIFLFGCSITVLGLKTTKIFMGCMENNCGLYSNTTLNKGELIHCVDQSHIIDSTFKNGLVKNIFGDCSNDNNLECKSNAISIKLTLCLEDIVECEILDISPKSKAYYKKIYQRMKTFGYPQLWESGKLELLNNTLIKDTINDYLKDFRTDYDMFVSKMKKIGIRNIPITDYDKWIIYRMIPITRAFNVNINKHHHQLIVPDIDMINHNSMLANTLWKYDKTKLCIYTTKPITKGSQLYFDYGGNDAQRICVNYGVYDSNLKHEINFYDSNDNLIININNKQKVDGFLVKKITDHFKSIYLKDKGPRIIKTLCETTIKKEQQYAEIIPKIPKDNHCIKELLIEELKMIALISGCACSI